MTPILLQGQDQRPSAHQHLSLIKRSAYRRRARLSFWLLPSHPGDRYTTGVAERPPQQLESFPAEPMPNISAPEAIVGLPRATVASSTYLFDDTYPWLHRNT